MTLGAAEAQLSLQPFHDFYEEHSNPFDEETAEACRALVQDVLEAHNLEIGDEQVVLRVRVRRRPSA